MPFASMAQDALAENRRQRFGRERQSAGPGIGMAEGTAVRNRRQHQHIPAAAGFRTDLARKQRIRAGRKMRPVLFRRADGQDGNGAAPSGNRFADLRTGRARP